MFLANLPYVAALLFVFIYESCRDILGWNWASVQIGEGREVSVRRERRGDHHRRQPNRRLRLGNLQGE